MQQREGLGVIRGLLPPLVLDLLLEGEAAAGRPTQLTYAFSPLFFATYRAALAGNLGGCATLIGEEGGTSRLGSHP